ncbi:MAG: FGGY family carbohydrate kinase [Actinomycetota bacterium]
MGLDVGTTRVKAVVVDPTGRIVASAWRDTPWFTDLHGTSMDPGALGVLVSDVSAEAAADAVSVTGGQMAGIGLSGMGEAGVLVDDADQPVAPVWAWHDRRADVDTVRRDIGEDTFSSTTGMPLTGQPSLCKVLRQIRELDAPRGRMRFLSVPEWAARCLGARPVSELSLASRTGLLDVVTGAPWEAARDLVGQNLLSELVAAGSDIGPAHGPAVADQLRGARITVAGHDHQVAALSVGAITDGTLLDSMGTAEALLRFSSEPLQRQTVASLTAQGITVGRTVVPDHWCALGGLLTGFALQRLAQGTAIEVVAHPSGVAGYRQLAARSDRLALPGSDQQVADVHDLIAMAEASRDVGAGVFVTALYALLDARRQPPPVQLDYNSPAGQAALEAWLSTTAA